MFKSAWESLSGSIPKPSHQPLNQDGLVRLIQLVPDASTQSDDGFRLVLQHFELKNAPPFHVLSYTRGPSLCEKVVEEWENISQTLPAGGLLIGRLASALSNVLPAGCASVKVNGGTVSVHQTVMDFLVTAHQQGKYKLREQVDVKAESKDQDTYLWIDAICIDQSDDEERGKQVTQLGDLYEAANKTIVWLSNSKPTDEVDWVLSAFAPKCLEVLDSNTFNSIWDPSQSLIEGLPEGDVNRWHDAILPFCTFIAKHQYFWEGWIQEIILSYDVEVQCEKKSWSWTALEQFLVKSAIGANSFLKAIPEPRIKMTQQWHKIIFQMEQIASIRDWLFEKTPEERHTELTQEFGPLQEQEVTYCQLLRLLRIFRGKRFEDKSDYLYGWLALTKLITPDGKVLMPADYSLTPKKLFEQLNKDLLQNMPTLDVLNDSEQSWMLLPRWMADYTTPPHTPLLYNRQRDRSKADFDATFVSEGRPRRPLEFDAQGLTVSGVLLDTIKHRGPQFPESMGDLDIEWMLEKCLEMEKHPLTGQSPQEALCFTLIADTLDLGEGPVSYARAFWAWWHVYFRCRREKRGIGSTEELEKVMARLAASSSTAERWIPSSFEPSDDYDMKEMNEPTVAKALTRVMQDLIGKTRTLWPTRAPYVSEQGYWGLGSHSVAPGDEIWLLEGGRTPYILRRRWGMGWRLVGETYVHGLMYGEGWTPERRKNMVWRRLE